MTDKAGCSQTVKSIVKVRSCINATHKWWHVILVYSLVHSCIAIVAALAVEMSMIVCMCSPTSGEDLSSLVQLVSSHSCNNPWCYEGFVIHELNHQCAAHTGSPYNNEGSN